MKTVWRKLTILCLLFSTTDVLAATWSLDIGQWQATEPDPAFEENPAKVKRRHVAIAYQWTQENLNSRLSYEFQPVLIRTGDPAFNGYFHQLDLIFEYRHGPTKFELTTGVHGSSNMFKYFDFHSDSLVVTFSIMHLVRDGGTQLGINGDHRFGNFHLYPRVSFSKQLSAEGQLIVDFPIALLWRTNHWEIGISRFGEKWAAMDSERDVESAFYLNEWRVGAKRQMPVFNDKAVFDLGIGISADITVRYLDLGRGWLEMDLAPAVFVTAGLKF